MHLHGWRTTIDIGKPAFAKTLFRYQRLHAFDGVIAIGAVPNTSKDLPHQRSVAFARFGAPFQITSATFGLFGSGIGPPTKVMGTGRKHLSVVSFGVKRLYPFAHQFRMREFLWSSDVSTVNDIGDGKWIIRVRCIDRSDCFIKTSVHDAYRSALGTKIDGERENTVVERGGCITDNGEVLKVILRLFNEASPLIATDGRKIATLYRCGPVSEPLEHCIKIKFVGHGPTLDQSKPRSSRVTKGSGRNASANIGLTGPTGPVASGTLPVPVSSPAEPLASDPAPAPPGRVARQ